MRRKRYSALVAVGLLAASAGCGGTAGLYPVSGRVTYRGEPAAGATLSFYPTDANGSGGPVPRGEVESDGSFRLVCGDLGRGAPPGRYAVLVEWRQGPLRTHRLDATSTAARAAAREGKPTLMADDRLKGRYSDAAHPRLAAEVKAGGNVLPTFELAD